MANSRPKLEIPLEEVPFAKRWHRPMKKPCGSWRVAGLAGALGVCSGTLNAAEQGAPQPAPVRCEIAVVSPVSGFAECVKPRGAPVEQPPTRPALTPEQCRKHGDLEVGECADAAPPQTPGG